MGNSNLCLEWSRPRQWTLLQQIGRILPRNLGCLVLSAAFIALAPFGATAQQAPFPIKMVIHGGAGTITPENLDADRQTQYARELETALQAGYKVLNAGGTSIDAVVAAIAIMEESPLFNSGRGAVLTSAGTAELDASIMEGRTRNAGAVASVKTVKSPIDLARRVMENSKHVMLVGEGAEAFAKEQGVDLVPNDYFRTQRRVEQYRRTKERLESESDTGHRRLSPHEDELRKFGTVGAVALDRNGDLAAGTSTGGISFKLWGRVGDSPIIGAGTYADNETCAISATGDGEYFIRGVIAHDIAAMMRYAGMSLEEAATAAIHEKLPEMGGGGGVIGLDRHGNVAMTFNTAGMFRGTVDADGNIEVKMFGD